MSDPRLGDLPAQTSTNTSTLAEIRAQIIAKSRPDADGYVDFQSLQALVNSYKLLSGEAPDTPTPINVGGGKVALYDPKTGQFTVQDLNALTPEQKATAAAQEKADLEYKQAQTALAQQQTATSASNVRTPEERQAGINQANASANASNASANASNASAWANSPAGIRARADAEASAAVAAANAKVAAGLEMKEEDRIKLTADLRMIADKAAADIKAAQDKEAFERDQPNKDRAFEQAERQLAAQQQTAQRAEDRTRSVEQARSLKDTAGGFQNQLFEAAKLGVAPQAGLSQALVFDPYREADRILNEMVARGEVRPDQVPQGKPPVQTGAPAPASGAAPMPGSAPTPRDTPPAAGNPDLEALNKARYPWLYEQKPAANSGAPLPGSGQRLLQGVA